VKLIRNIALGILALTLIGITLIFLIFSGIMPQTSEEKALHDKILATQRADQEKAEQQKNSNP
jgi:hypothetical protein